MLFILQLRLAGVYLQQPGCSQAEPSEGIIQLGLGWVLARLGQLDQNRVLAPGPGQVGYSRERQDPVLLDGKAGRDRFGPAGVELELVAVREVFAVNVEAQFGLDPVVEVAAPVSVDLVEFFGIVH